MCNPDRTLPKDDSYKKQWSLSNISMRSIAFLEFAVILASCAIDTPKSAKRDDREQTPSTIADGFVFAGIPWGTDKDAARTMLESVQFAYLSDAPPIGPTATTAHQLGGLLFRAQLFDQEAEVWLAYGIGHEIVATYIDFLVESATQQNEYRRMLDLMIREHGEPTRQYQTHRDTHLNSRGPSWAVWVDPSTDTVLSLTVRPYGRGSAASRLRMTFYSSVWVDYADRGLKSNSSSFLDVLPSKCTDR